MLYANQHGDITARYLSAGVTASRAFDPFGQPSTTPADAPTLGYQGAWTDPATGAANMAARWYSPTTGAFLSRDDWPLQTDPSANANRYLYGNADPLDNTDPTGHCIEDLCIGEAAIVVGLVAAGYGIYLGVKAAAPYVGKAVKWGWDQYGKVLDWELRQAVGVAAWASNLPNWVLGQQIRLASLLWLLTTHLTIRLPCLAGLWGSTCTGGGGSVPGDSGLGGKPSGGGPKQPSIPKWIHNANDPIGHPGNGTTVIPRAATAAADTPMTAVADPGPEQTAEAGAITAAAATSAAAIVGTGDPGNDDDEYCGPSYRDLVGRGLGDSHHVYQDAAMRDLPGYSRRDAPAVPLKGPSTAKGSEHYNATQAQRQYGGGTVAAEGQIAFQALLAAGYSIQDALEVVTEAAKYFRGIGA
jgi:RHS repeat-associated protein